MQFVIAIVWLGFAQPLLSQTALRGKVTDDAGEPVIFGSVALYKNGVLDSGTETDFDGNYYFSNIDPGTYDVQVSYVGFETQNIKGVKVLAGKSNKLDVTMSSKTINLQEVVVTEYKVPLVEQDNTTSGSVISFGRGNYTPGGRGVYSPPAKSNRKKRKKKKDKKGTLTSEDIKNLPTRNINSLAANTAGLQSASEGNQTAVRGSRDGSTDYYIDGIRVRGNLIPSESSGHEVEMGGTPASEATNDAGTATQPPPPPPSNKDKAADEVNQMQIENFMRGLPVNTLQEDYAEIIENEYIRTASEKYSTFSIDVDNAAYSNVRRFVNSGQLPPPGAVRTEELLNYFNYNYPQPEGEHPFAVYTELSDCPWNKEHRLLHIGLKGYEANPVEAPPANLVFLVDVSGSMSSHNKLPLVKQSLSLLIDELRPQDRISLVTYAGTFKVVLEPTPGSERTTIKNALNQLHSGGGTAGGAAIQRAYELAAQYYLPEGSNRVILATDGDFNIGISSATELEKFIAKKRKSGVYLSVLGFGTGNYQDSRMEALSNKGNGNYAYIDNLQEAEKVLVTEMSGTLLTIANDVKLQLEFDSSSVASYRLIGYENRMLETEDFEDDTKDAGELGSGHTVTALYEIVPGQSSEAALGTLHLRYKRPNEQQSYYLKHSIPSSTVPFEQASENYCLSAAVAAYALCLRNSAYKGTASYEMALSLAKSAQQDDLEGYRQAFVKMIKETDKISNQLAKKR
jgi:Ca-activated chloride channel family protein